MTFTVPYSTPVEVPSNAWAVHSALAGINALTANAPTDGNPFYLMTGNIDALHKVVEVATILGMTCHIADLPDLELSKDQKLLTVMTKQDASYHQMKVGDALVWEDPRMPQRHIHVWTIQGIHIGGTGQESVIALKNASHSNAWDETEIETMYVPEVLLRGCKLMQAKKVTVTKQVGGDPERPAPTIKVEG